MRHLLIAATLLVPAGLLLAQQPSTDTTGLRSGTDDPGGSTDAGVDRSCANAGHEAG